MNQIKRVSNFQDLVSTPFSTEINAICWSRQLEGDFKEIVDKLKRDEDIAVITEEDLLELNLSEQAEMARAIVLNDMQALKEHGASPVLNLIRHYQRDEAQSFFPTDVYSFHVDRSPLPTDTFLCTYYGASSEIVANSQARQKILIPEIRKKLRTLYQGSDATFEDFLTEHFYDLHYEAEPGANIIRLAVGELCRLSVDYPGNPALPCIHRAPVEKAGEKRLLLIC